MKTVEFEGIRQAARILSCVQPYVKKTEDEWVDDIKNRVKTDYEIMGKFSDSISVCGYTLLRGEDIHDIITYEVFVGSVMIDQFVQNDFQAKSYSYCDIEYHETMTLE